MLSAARRQNRNSPGFAGANVEFAEDQTTSSPPIPRFAQNRHRAWRTSKMAMTADLDVIFGFYREGNALRFSFSRCRRSIVGGANFFGRFGRCGIDVSEFLRSSRAYYSTDYVPLEIHVPRLADREVLEKALRLGAGAKYGFRPETRAESEMIDSSKTREIAFEQRFRVLKPDTKSFGDLQEILELRIFPNASRALIFPIFRPETSRNSPMKTQTNRAEYRRFIINRPKAQRFRLVNEAVFRRYKRLLMKKNSPQLIFIDGGKGQLSPPPRDALFGLEAITLVGLVKPPKRPTKFHIF